MKLRVKHGSSRSTIEIDVTATLKELYEICRQFLPGRNYFLSLNCKDEIACTEELHLSSIGVVAGDLIHVLNKEEDMNCLKDQLMFMGFEQNAILKVLNSFGATNLNDAIELLSMIGASATSSATSVNIEDKKTLDKNTLVQTKEDVHKTEVITTEQAECSHVKTSTVFQPLFLQDGITDSFRQLFAANKCEKHADFLFLLIHGLLLETGFKTQASTSCDVSTEDLNEKTRHQVALPEQWKNPEMGFYRLNYSYVPSAELKFCLTASLAGKSLLVSGTLDVKDSEAYQIKLNISDYIHSEKINTGGVVTDIYLNVGKLSHKIKDGIATKIINEIRTKLGLQKDLTCLSSLPLEVQLRIICWLDTVSICRFSQVTQGFRKICNDESIWKRILHRDFRASNPIGTTYKQAVQHMHKMRRDERTREEERMSRLRQPRTPLRPDFEIVPDVIYPDAPGREFPGIIGGYNDLYPFGGFHPGGFPAHPLHANRPTRPDLLRNPGRIPGRGDVRPPGARFDPYGPIPDDDDDYLTGRQPHPDMLHRPRFGPGNGFGGGGGGFGFT